MNPQRSQVGSGWHSRADPPSAIPGSPEAAEGTNNNEGSDVMNECDQTLDGKHHYGPRRYLGSNHAYSTVIACKCGRKPEDEGLVKAQLEAVDRYRKSLVEQAKRFTVKTAPDEQGKLAL